MKTRQISILWKTLTCIALLAGSAAAQWNPLNPVKDVKQQSDGVVMTMERGTLRLLVCTDSIVRVSYAPGATFSDTPQYVVIKSAWAPSPFTFTDGDKEATLATGKLKITVTKKDGAILFTDANGKLFQDFDRTLTPAVVNGEQTYHSELFSNLWDSTEAFYGLGQHQAGVWNYHGEDVEISQDNTNISVPVILSSRGYGIFWNNPSRSRFNNRFPHALYLSAEVADTFDYYFLYGPDFDKIIASYREMTGAAPLFGKWAYGYWQCKNKYNSEDEVLAVAKKYRDLKIPVDNIVQDWFWWNHMGEPVFNKNYPDPKRMIEELHKLDFHIMFSFWPYFDPPSPVYDDMTEKGYLIDKTVVGGFHPQGMALYDAFNPAARKYYWNLINTGLFQLGADAWWLDTDEPETEGRQTPILENNKVAIGSGARYADLFPLMTTTAVYEGQRSATDQKRVFILSRSAYAGVQRNSVTAWSGDVESNWLAFARQIPAGLNFELSGLPYWTTDIGGFISGGNPDDPAYRELYIRWFEYGSFCPIFRAHGTRTTNQNEIWSYGPDAQIILTSYDRLRYRLLPYIYSLGWMTTDQGYTPMRALAMDFRTDVRAQNIGDEYLYGPAILVAPVTEPGATVRHLYLPKARWYDFWTGKAVDGGAAIDTAAPIERIPLFVRAGSIVPLGPDVQWASEKPADPIELRVYAGADGHFTLYEDQNDTYNYEKGQFATIAFAWDDSSHRLTIGDRKGNFPGMLAKRTFHVVFVGDAHGNGIDPTATADKTIEYSGQLVSVSR